MATDQHRPSQDSIQAVTPGQVRHCLQITHPFGTVKVRGLVVELQATPATEPKYAIGRLRDLDDADGSLLDFHCPIHQAPRAVQQVVDITGTLYPKIDAKQMTVVLRGHCEAVAYDGSVAARPASLVRERSKRMRLDTLIDQGHVQRIAVVGTKAAHSAILEALDHPQAADRIPLYLAKVSQVEDLVKQLLGVKQDGFDACVLAQSSGEASSSAWYADRLVEQFEPLGFPVYTALGQPGTITPADHYADESFTTPTAFGVALKSAIERLAHHQELIHSRNDSLALHEKALTELRLARESFDKKLEVARRDARRRGRRAMLWGLMLGVAAAGASAWAMQQSSVKALLQQYVP